MLVKILGVIIGFFLMILSIIGLIRNNGPQAEQPPAMEAAGSLEEGDTITFGRAWSIRVPEQMHIVEDRNFSASIGYNEDTQEAFVLRAVVPEQPMTLPELEEICQGLLEDVSVHAAGDVPYLSGYDRARDTDILVTLDPESGEVFVFGLTGTDDDMPASRYFQTLAVEE